MTFTFGQLPTSGNSAKESYELKWRASGIDDDTYVRAVALSAAPLTVWIPEGVLHRQDVALDHVGWGLFIVTASYGPKNKTAGSYSATFDTTGGTLTIKASLSTIASYSAGGAIPNHGGAIGVNGDEVEGAEIVIPALKETITFRHPQGVIDQAKIKALARMTGKVNSDTFLTFDAGEVLFLGATGSDGSEAEAEIQYQFAMSENLQNKVIGGITVAQKNGWDVSWIQFAPQVVGGLPVRKPMYIYVERVYERTSLSGALGFGA